MSALSCGPRVALAAAVFAGLSSNACGDSFSFSPRGVDDDAAGGAAGASGVAGASGAAGRGAAPGDATPADSAKDVDSGSGDSALDAPPDPPIPTQRLLLWLRADRGVLLESGLVERWADQSANRLDAIAASVGMRPKPLSAGIGDRPSIEFDGVDDFLQLPTGFADFSSGLSLFATIQQASSTACTAIVEFSNGGEIDDVSFGQFGNRLLYEVFEQPTSHGALPIGEPLLLAVIHRPDGTFEVRQNGQMTGEGTKSLPAPIPRQQNFVGRTLYGGCVMFAGQISELVVYDRSVSNAEVLTIEESLRSRANCCKP